LFVILSDEIDQRTLHTVDVGELAVSNFESFDAIKAVDKKGVIVLH